MYGNFTRISKQNPLKSIENKILLMFVIPQPATSITWCLNRLFWNQSCTGMQIWCMKSETMNILC